MTDKTITVHLDPDLFKEMHDSFKPHEDWSDRVRRAFEAEQELDRLKKSESRQKIAPTIKA